VRGSARNLERMNPADNQTQDKFGTYNQSASSSGVYYVVAADAQATFVSPLYLKYLSPLRRYEYVDQSH
jgi:hypothetical protein